MTTGSKHIIMSSHLNILLDTNIIISLNDLEYPLDPKLAEMQRLLDQLSFHVFVHPAQKDDLNRDTNADRRRRNLSRLDQYNVLNSPPEPSPEDISALGWVENRDNDRVDNLLLYALKSGAVHSVCSIRHDFYGGCRDSAEGGRFCHA